MELLRLWSAGPYFADKFFEWHFFISGKDEPPIFWVLANKSRRKTCQRFVHICTFTITKFQISAFPVFLRDVWMVKNLHYHFIAQPFSCSRHPDGARGFLSSIKLWCTLLWLITNSSLWPTKGSRVSGKGSTSNSYKAFLSSILCTSHWVIMITVRFLIHWK